MSFLDIVKKINIEPIKQKRSRKPKTVIESGEEMDFAYRPAGWLDSPYSFNETIQLTESFRKKKKDLTDSEKIIIHNYEILKSCYRTPKHLLKLAKTFIGEFNFDPFYNTYGFTGLSEFATEDFKSLSGYSDKDDGFKLSNWYDATFNLEEVIGWGNPPFNKLESAASLVNTFSKEKEVRFAFLSTLDYTNYLQNCMQLADYFIMLGRVQFLGMPGIKMSSPRGSVGMLIYNSKLNIDDSQFIEFEGNIYYCINLKKQRQMRNLSQLTLEDLLKPLSPEKASLIPPLNSKIIDETIEQGRREAILEGGEKWRLI